MSFHPTFRQLAVFEAVSKYLSFTRAAEALHLSQPAVSMQIKQLESQVGLPLFDQLGKKVYLTTAGKALRVHAIAIARRLKEAEAIIGEMKGLRRGHLNITVASTANSFSTGLLATFIQLHPEVTFSLDVTNRRKIIKALDANEPDLVIMGQPPDGLDVVAEAFMENPLVVVASVDHPLAKKSNIEPKMLGSEQFVVREQGSGTRTAMERFFAEQGGVEIESRMEFSDHEAIKQAVRSGLGLAVVSIHTIRLELSARELVVLDVKATPIKRNWHLVYRRRKRLSPVAEAFRQFVLTEAPELILANDL